MTKVITKNCFRKKQVVLDYQLNDFLNSKGDIFVFFLKSLLNDCGYSNPN